MSANYTIEELITIHLAHTFADGEVGFTGLATGDAAAKYITAIPLAAMQFAKKTHAPNLTVLLAGWIHNPKLEKLDHMPDSEFDASLLDLPCEAQMMQYPGQWSHKRGDVSFGFGSGVQVDRFGNINSVCVGDPNHPKVWLVGSILLPEHMTKFRREYIMMPHHQARNFVEKVDYISGVGYPGGVEGRKKLGLKWGGPEYVYTPRCIFKFHKKTGSIYVHSIHPGVTKEDVIENTGIDLGNLDDVPTTPEPTKEELEILRNEVDPKKILLYQT